MCLKFSVRGQLAHVGLVGIEGRLGLGQRGILFVGFLLRNGVGLDHGVPAIGGGLGDLHGGLGLLGGRLGLAQLLVHFGRVESRPADRLRGPTSPISTSQRFT